MLLEFAISALVTLLVVVDPAGLVPAFIAMTAGLPAAARRQVARVARSVRYLLLTSRLAIG
jgi:multiple antibiotic resistance protein